ncbi:hypothetical protein GC425_05240 [Corynebacterium sp. zg254]|uniref:Zinc finger CGNR domain-containing protein n=1 Tax=Corynebacterium zhongnanshanii TaxID=2768834 RepID=A0ABQ6VE64_9CORY|nr:MULTISPECIES: CGNR zinc finger domain-containing protein [Corynebacterium]KAB3522679.1 hypothetical protein F8377_00370 [Corynebacterium zhongnanshanii]MCR5914272.1 hypothetical protein [Corynebacterium sp. zg254]
MSNTAATTSQELDFVFHGARPSLDFANTLRRRKDPLYLTVDLLHDDPSQDPSSLARWIEACRDNTAWGKTLPGLQHNTPCPSFNEIEQLRQSIFDLAEATLSSGELVDPARAKNAVDTLNTWAQHQPQPQLDTLADSRTFRLRSNMTLKEVLGFVARDAIELFGTSDIERLKECAHERCGILFEDRSQGRRRQWCSMKKCGNRTKANRFSQNKRTP